MTSDFEIDEIWSRMFSFSPCSKRQIAVMIELRANICFEEGVEGAELCGNGVVDALEECDCGSDKRICEQTDPCCAPKGWEGPDYQCNLRRSDNRWCSPTQGPCCAGNCDFLARGSSCPVYEEITKKCMVGSGACLGQSATCSVSSNTQWVSVADGSPCNSGEKTCKLGKCESSVCQDKGLADCVCPKEGDDRCEVCCRRSSCVPASQLNVYGVGGSKVFYSKGTPCRDDRISICDGRGRCTSLMTSTSKWNSTTQRTPNGTFSFSSTPTRDDVVWNISIRPPTSSTKTRNATMWRTTRLQKDSETNKTKVEASKFLDVLTKMKFESSTINGGTGNKRVSGKKIDIPEISSSSAVESWELADKKSTEPKQMWGHSSFYFVLATVGAILVLFAAVLPLMICKKRSDNSSVNTNTLSEAESEESETENVSD